MSTDWDLKLTAALSTLSGSVVTDVWVQEMALYGPEDAGHFADPSLNFVQANVLELRTADGRTFHISCVQNDDAWAIWPRLVSADLRLTPDPGEGTFRTRLMPEFPSGPIGALRIDGRHQSNIQEVRMMIGQREVFLRAGEVYENTDGTLTVCDQDESVLVFLDGDSYSRLKFNEPLSTPSGL